MFGTNPKIGKKYFKDAPEGTLNVASLFYTLQGEGPLSGKPAVFLRLAQCNLSCGFCDTYFQKGDTLKFANMVLDMGNEVHKFYENRNIPIPSKLDFFNEGNIGSLDLALVITGGEPTLQDNLYPFIEGLQDTNLDGTWSRRALFKYVQIETNGILPWKGDKETILVVSPKCVEDKNGKPLHHIVPAKQNLERANCLKFVVTADETSAYHTIPDWALEWRDTTQQEVFISPMNIYLREPQNALIAQKTNTTLSLEERSEALERISFWETGLLDMETNRANHEYAAELCMRYGFRLSLQTHLLASLP